MNEYITPKHSEVEDTKTSDTLQQNSTVEGSKVLQYVAASAVNLAAMTAGCVLGWASPTLPKLDAPGSNISITPVQGSWIGSLVTLGAAVGPFPGAYLADKIGRKWSMLALAIPFLISWILITSAQNVAMIYAGRVIGGIAVGAVYTVAPMYVGEIAEDSIRGALGSLLNAFISVGYLYEYAIGPYVSYVWLGIASIIIPCLFVALFFFMPDSPYYLMGKGKKEEATKALMWFRGSSRECVAKEIEMIQDSVDETSKNTGSIKDLFSTRGNIKALYLSCSLVAFQELMGIDAILFYSTPIFELSGTSMSDDISTIIIGIVMVVGSFVTPLIVERLGRRVLLFISGIGMAVMLFALGFFFYLKEEKGMDLNAVGWIPIFCLILYIAIYSIGWGPLPWAVMGELFPTNVKGIASAITSSVCWLTGFVITKYFENIVSALGAHVAFWIFGVFCFLAVVFVFFLLPETRGRSLLEIQDVLNKKKSTMVPSVQDVIMK